MSSQIKFRAWDKKYGMNDVAQLTLHAHSQTALVWITDNRTVQVDKPKIMQYAGLKDKSGVEIYEGDIGWDDHNEQYGKVVFEDGAFGYEWDGIYELLNECAGSIEIRGNLYENPELLK
jgi:hypothetical protein